MVVTPIMLPCQQTGLTFRDAIAETRAFGFEKTRQLQIELGRLMRDLMKTHGFVSVAAEGFQAPSVIVSFTNGLI